MHPKIIVEISRWQEEECRLGSTVGQKYRGTRRYCKPRNFLFQFAINKSTTPSLTEYARDCSLESSTSSEKDEKRESDGRRRTKRTVVQLGRIKGIKGRLVIRIFRFSTSTPIRRKRRDEGEKKDVGKFAPFLLRDLGSLVPLLPPLVTSAPLQGANVCINRS